MSYANELAETFEELKDLPEDLQKSITSKFAKLSSLKQLTGETALQRDSARLDARQRAYYKKMGMELPEDGEMITNILADNITIGEDPVIAKTNVGNESTVVDDPPNPKPQPQPPQQPKPNGRGRVPTWAKWAIAGLIGSNAIGAGGLTYYFLNPPPQTDPTGSVFKFETELPPWME